MPSGSVSESSGYCTSMRAFQNSLAGKTAVAIEISAGSTTRLCNDTHVANQIVAAFSTCTSSCSTRSFSCEGKTWYVGTCGSGGEITVGRRICDCGEEVTIRPCINNQNWGGAGSTCGQSSMKLGIDVFVTGN